MSLFGKLKYRKAPTNLSRQLRQKAAKPSVILEDNPLTEQLEHNLAIFEGVLGTNSDLLIRRFQIQLRRETLSCA